MDATTLIQGIVPERLKAAKRPASIDTADQSQICRQIPFAVHEESLPIHSSGRHGGACLLLLSVVSLSVLSVEHVRIKRVFFGLRGVRTTLLLKFLDGRFQV